MGGIASSFLTAETEVVSLCMDMLSPEIVSCKTCPLVLNDDVPRPMLIGVSTASLNGSTLVMGGGAVCFSFGSRWNEGSYEIEYPRDDFEYEMMLEYGKKSWKLLENTPKVSGIYPERSNPASARKRSQAAVDTVATIPRVRIADVADFERIVKVASPVIIEGLDLGTCTKLWSAQYLKEMIGPDREVSSPLRS